MCNFFFSSAVDDIGAEISRENMGITILKCLTITINYYVMWKDVTRDDSPMTHY